ncbi:hypothetical protein [Commensalibacter communis]|uniref:hypothetical protein n=1 Tax=Commensalibacter communis TaxID=2972786 RepID=UPI0022FF9CC8|nr:hypothetical protein [Commensalibacter communis]CAI3958694.1 unnamed protein product [Commensalibacter communis]CAI3959665.1 unnamed protein product [Commensalibacter communis]
MSITRPKLYLSKWAENGKRFDVPDSVSDTAMGKANIQTGFPEITMKSVLNGGVPPWGQDHNGILNRLTQDIQWEQAGGMPVFNASLCNKMIGYPLGAELRSTRYPYVSYVNMVEGNLENPDNSTNIDSYWNGTRLGNGWAIKTILSKDPDNISYLDSDFRILTKVAGAKTSIFVRPGYKKNDPLVDLEKITGIAPYTTIKEALEAVPDGGSATIYLWNEAEYSLYDDLSLTARQDLTNGWNIGHRSIDFLPYGQQEFLNEANDLIAQNGIVSDAYIFAGIKRPIIHIPVGFNPSTKDTTYGFLVGSYGSIVTFKSFRFCVDKGQVGAGQNGSPFHPYIKFTFSNCTFENIDRLRYLYGGWGGATNTILFNRCNIVNPGIFAMLGDDITTLIVHGNSNDTTGLERFGSQFGGNESNDRSFFSSVKNYGNFQMVVTSYKDNLGKEANYAPLGLQTYLKLDFS